MSASEVESLKQRIRRLEEDLAKVNKEKQSAEQQLNDCFLILGKIRSLGLIVPAHGEVWRFFKDNNFLF